MILTKSLVVIADYMLDKLKDNKATLGIMEAYYGDQDKLATTPVVCVEPQYKANALRQAATARMLDIEFNLTFLVYHSFIVSPQENRRGSDALAQDIEDLVHSDRDLNGLVIHGYCTLNESGYTTKGNSLVRSNKITYVAQSQFVLPS